MLAPPVTIAQPPPIHTVDTRPSIPRCCCFVVQQDIYVWRRCLVVRMFSREFRALLFSPEHARAPPIQVAADRINSDACSVWPLCVAPEQHRLELVPGMTFTIEPIFTEGSEATTLWPDAWTVQTVDGGRAAQFEHVVLVTEEGHEVLTVPSQPVDG